MRCSATTKRANRQCSRIALPGQPWCRLHASDARRAPGSAGAAPRHSGPAGFYELSFSPEDQMELVEAAGLEGIDQEIAVLRVLIRRVANQGDLDNVRKGIDTLCRALKIQYALDDRSADTLASSLAKVLEEVGREIGLAL